MSVCTATDTTDAVTTAAVPIAAGRSQRFVPEPGKWEKKEAIRIANTRNNAVEGERVI